VVAVDPFFGNPDAMRWRDQNQTWLQAWSVQGSAKGLPRRLRRWAGPAALAAGAFLALCFGLRDSPSTWARYQVGYQCWRNVYDCRDFHTQAEAQAVYEACGGPKRDVHHLDWDGNGRACDYLP
jgi:hypothetical protein